MNVKKFVKHWSSHGYEKGKAQPFWLSFLRDVFDMDKLRPEREPIKISLFVSTNSITQGEQVTPLWKKLFDEYNMQIIFGRRTFKWDSESFNKAAIHCVVIGMADKNLPVDKKIFDGEEVLSAISILISSTPRRFLSTNHSWRDGLSFRDINKLNSYVVDESGSRTVKIRLSIFRERCL